MSAAVAVTPTTRYATVTAMEFAATGLTVNDSTSYDPDNFPSEDPINYYFTLEKSGQDSLVSPVFGPSADGDGEWHDVIAPAAGTWTAHVRKVSDDSSVANASVVVSA